MKITTVILLFLLSAAYLQAQPATWTRTELQGTGLSVESPKAFELVQDKPDPFLEHQAAYIFWRLSHNGIFATIIYEKVKRVPKTPRQKLDDTAKLFAGQNKPTVSKVSDTTFQGQPAALFEEEFFEPYAKKNMRRKMLTYGPTGELTTINFSWPVDDAAAKTAAERMFNSIQRAGAVAAETSKAPPADWKRVSLRGLTFETPTTNPNSDCNAASSNNVNLMAETRCYLWGRDFSITVRYHMNRPGKAPSPAEMLRHTQLIQTELDGKSTLKTRKEISTPAINIKGADAAHLRTFTSYGTVASAVENIYIRKGDETWQVEIIRAVRWDFAEEAATRIMASLSFATILKVAPARVDLPTLPPAPKTAADFYRRARALYAQKNDKSAEADLNEAIRLDPKMADAYMLRSRIYCHQKLIISAIREEDKAIALGGKVDYRCGRTPGPVPR